MQGWVKALYAAYDHVCYAYRLSLRRPTIEVKSFAKLGQWDPLLRCISISEALIVEQSWDCVVNVLKHEMAHQYVDEILGKPDGHGAQFKLACEKMGLPMAFQRAHCDLSVADLVRGHAASPEHHAILKRVKKLLSLAQSANEHEALVAMQKAQELNARYNLNEVPEFELNDHDYIIIYTKRKRLEAYRQFICSILTSHYFVEVLFAKQYDAQDDTEYQVIELLGSRQNIEMAEYVYHFLVNKLEQLWRAYRKTAKTALGRSSKNAYFVGLASGFHKKLDAMQEAHQERHESKSRTKASDERKLVVAHNDAMLDRFMRSRYPRIRNVKKKTRLRDQSSYAQGLADGRKIVLNKGLNGGQNSGVPLLIA